MAMKALAHEAHCPCEVPFIGSTSASRAANRIVSRSAFWEYFGRIAAYYGENLGMPVHWSIDTEARLFEVTCTGMVEADEIHRMLDVLVGSEALGYRKLFDGSQADTNLGPLDILSIGVRMRGLHGDGAPLGPLAVVIPPDKYPLLSRVLGILASPRRPMRIFSEVDRARKWLDSAPIRRRLPAPEEDVSQPPDRPSVVC